MKSWVIAGDVLEIAVDGARLPATAEQVYSSVLEDSPAWEDLPPGKCGAARGLTFSRYPVRISVVIAAAAEAEEPSVRFEARTQQGVSFPISAAAVRAGHVVHADVWYPGVPDERDAIAALLGEIGFDTPTGTLRTLKGYLTLKKSAAEGGPVIDHLPDVVLKRFAFRSTASLRPEGIKGTLYPYQVDGWQWLCFIIREHLGGVLADEMGLGKTLQVISALRDPGVGERCSQALVIAPGSLLENWVREIAKFCPSFTALKHHGAMRTGTPAELKGIDVVVASYDTAVRDLSLLKMVQWDVVVLDEAQNIRNPDAIRTKSVKEIGRKVALAVTGTPVENRLRDLWSIMDFAVPGFLGDLRSFEHRYGENTEAAASLEPLVSPLILRRRVADVACDLPERVDIPEILELSPDEASAYDKVRQTVVEEYGAAATLVSLGKLRQFCAHPAILDGDYVSPGAEEFSKFERLTELLEEIFYRGEKALIFTSFTKMADRITRVVARNFRVMAATLDGRLDIGHRQPLVDHFTELLGPGLLVLNPRAGGTGLNITAANHVIHYNPEWNPAVEDQASARVYRRGQDRPVTIRRLIYAGTVEEVIDERLERKRGIADTAIIGVAGRDEDYADIVSALQRSPLPTRAGVT